MGSKNRIAKDILPIMLKEAEKHNITTWIESFAGGCNLIDKVPNTFKRIGLDNNPHTIQALIGIRDHLNELPSETTEEYYKEIKGTPPNPITSWIRFVASFGGRFENGYGRRNSTTKKKYTYTLTENGLNNAKKQSPLLQGIELICTDYDKYDYPDNCIVYCFDEQTELLTDKGFKLVKDITLEDMCLSREPNTNIIEYVSIDKVYQRYYKGDFYNYESRNVSIKITEDHNLFVNKIQTREKIKKDLLIKAKDSLTQSFNFISAGGIWKGNNKDTYTVIDTDYNAIDFAYLLGIFCTDGSINNQDNITISQSKTEIVNKIRNILNKLGMKYTENIFATSKESTTFYLSRKYIPFFKQFYLKENRKIPRDLMQYNVYVLKSLLEGIIGGDGAEGRRINIGSKSLVNDIQEICYKIGKSSSYIIRGEGRKGWYEREKRWITTKKDYYVVSVNNKPYLNCVKKNISITNEEKDVYCVTLSKWNTVLSRRNGKCIWIGQCDPPYKGVTAYKGTKFDHDKFWKWCEEMSKKHIVFISEYNAPDNFKCIWEKEIQTCFAANRTQAVMKTEKLFVYDNVI